MKISNYNKQRIYTLALKWKKLNGLNVPGFYELNDLAPTEPEQMISYMVGNWDEVEDLVKNVPVWTQECKALSTYREEGETKSVCYSVFHKTYREDAVRAGLSARSTHPSILYRDCYRNEIKLVRAPIWYEFDEKALTPVGG